MEVEVLYTPRRDDWKVINLVADGVSDLALKRAEHQRVFTSGAIRAITRIMEMRGRAREGIEWLPGDAIRVGGERRLLDAPGLALRVVPTWISAWRDCQLS